MAFFCPNFSNPQVKEDFNKLVSTLGENRAYFQWNKHKGDMEAISNELSVSRVDKRDTFDKYLEISNYNNIIEQYKKYDGYVPINRKNLNGKLYFEFDRSNPYSSGTLINSSNIGGYLKNLQEDLDISSFGGTHAFFQYISKLNNNKPLTNFGVKFEKIGNSVIVEYISDKQFRDRYDKNKYISELEVSLRALRKEVGNITISIPELEFNGSINSFLNRDRIDKKERLRNAPEVPDRSIPTEDKGVATKLREEYGVNKVKLLTDGIETLSSNNHVKKLDKLFNLVSIRKFKDGDLYKFFNPLTEKEADEVEDYIKRYYLDDSEKTGEFKVERVTPWDTSIKGMVGLHVSGFPIHIDELYNRAVDRMSNNEDEAREDLLPDPKSRQIVEIPSNVKEHYNKVLPILNLIDNGATPSEVLEYLKNNNLVSDKRLVQLVEVMLQLGDRGVGIRSIFDAELLEDERNSYMLYNPDENSIKVVSDIVLDSTQGNFDFFVRSILHEFIHAYSSRLINNPKTEEERKLGKELKKLYEAALSFSSTEMKEKYGATAFKNEKEFLAELMTDPVFLEDVVTNQKYNWWEKFLNWLSKVFKIDSLNQSIDKSVFDLVLKIMPENSRYTYDNNIGEIDQKKAQLQDKIYSIRENLDISDRAGFEKQLRSFADGFTRVQGKGIVHKDSGVIMLGVSPVMDEFNFGIDEEEITNKEGLKEAIDRSTAIGTIVHGNIESILTGKTAQIKNDLGLTGSIPLRKDLERIIAKFRGQKVTIMSEVFVGDLKKGLGGYIDMVIIDENNKIHLYDFKSKEKGFDKFETRYINQIDGRLKYSADQRAHAQLTLYKNMFETMTGYEVASINVVKLHPKVEGNKVTSVKLNEVKKYDSISPLGEGIYDSIKQVNLNSDPKMAALLHQQRIKTLGYKAMDFSKIDNTIEKIVSELESRLKQIRSRGGLLEAETLEAHLREVKSQKTPAKSLAILLNNGIVRTNGIIREFEQAKLAGRDIKIGQLFHWKELVEAYEGFQEYAQYLKSQIPVLKKEAKEYAKKIDEQITALSENVRFVSNLYTEEGIDKLVKFLLPYYNRVRVEQEHLVRADYRKLSKAEKEGLTENEYVRRYFEQPAVKEDIDDRTTAILKQELKVASRDIGTLGLWLSNVMDSRDPIVAATVKAFAKQEFLSHKEAINTRDKIVNVLRDFERTVNTSIVTDPKKIYDFMLEKDGGDYTGYLIDRFKSSLFEDYNEVTKKTRNLTLSKLKEISEDENSQINKIAAYHYEQNKGKEEDQIDFEAIAENIRKVWKNERTDFNKEQFNEDKQALLQEMLDNDEISQLEYEEITNNDAKFLRGESDLTLIGLAYAGVLNHPAADKITNWIYRNTWSYRTLKESYRDKYENEDFKVLADLQKNDPTNPKIMLYNLMVGLIQDANNMLPYSSRIGLRLPGVEKSTNEKLRAGDGLIDAFKHKLKSDFTVRPDDKERDNKELFNKQGRARYFLPIHYTGKVDPDKQSFDVPTIIFKFWQSANDFSNKAEILPEIELAKFLIENREAPTSTNKLKNEVNKVTTREELRSFNNNLAKQLNEWFMTCVYGMPKREQGKVLGIDVTKTIDALNRYTSLNLLGLNVIQGAANTILGESLQIAEQVAGEYMSKGSYRKGTAFYMKNFGGVLGDIGSRSPKNVVTRLMDEFDILDEWEGTDFTTNQRYRQLMRTDTLFFTTHAGEHEMQGRFLLSMLADKKAYDKHGNELGSMLDMYEVKEGRLTLKPEVDLETSEWTKDDQFEFGYKVRGILSRLHGEYSDLGRVAIQRGAMGRMAFMFRKFVEPGFQRRWGKRDYVERLEDFVEGNYVTFFNTFLKQLWLTKFHLGETWDSLSDHEKANVRRTLSEIAFLLSSMMLLTVAVKRLDDADDDKEIRRLSFLAYQAARLKSELLFYISPPQAWNILRSPMASMSVIENFIRLTSQLTSDPFELYERGPWKGKMKVAKYLTNMTPGYRQFYRVRDIRDQLAWFSNKVN